MDLLLDLGNTRLKWAWARDGAISHRGATPHADLPDRLSALWASQTPPARIVAASVAGEAKQRVLERWASTRWGSAIRWVSTPTEALGVRNGYALPQSLGVDRWLAMVAAYHHFRTAVCVVDCGSAVTVDLVGADGLHRGGAIVPGLRMMRRALGQDAARLPTIEAEPTGRLPATDTATGIAAGTLLGLAAMVDGLCRRVAGEVSGQAVRVLTGGDADVIAPWLAGDFHIDPDLIFKGLLLTAA